MITPDYKAELMRLHDKYIWGDSAGKYAGKTVVALLKKRPEIKTVLDYGCGKGTLKDFVVDAGITDREWTLYDPCVAEFSKRPEGKFDLVITTDVLEHVEEIMLRWVLEDLRNFTGKVLYNEIACYFTNKAFECGPYVGHDIHINIKAPCIWEERLKNRDFNLIGYKISVVDDWKLRYLLIQERKEGSPGA